MASLQAEDIADLITTTQKELGEGHVTDIASELQDYVAYNNLMNKEKKKVSSGTSIDFQLLATPGNNFRKVGLMAQDNLNQTDGELTGNVPWRHATNGITWDMRQFDMNRSPRKIVDFVSVKMAQAEIDAAAGFEEFFWGAPSSSTDELTPYGMGYWFTKLASTPGAFDSVNPSVAPNGRAGVDSTTYTNWANWSCQYTSVSSSDLIRKLREAYEKTKFKSPIKSVSNYDNGKGCGFYTTYDVLRQFEEQLESNNDNLGNDVAPKDGKVHFRGIPVAWVPYLEENATQGEFYGINWGVFHAEFLEGWDRKKTKPKVKEGQHTVMEQFEDTSFNYVCRDLRKNFLLATA